MNTHKLFMSLLLMAAAVSAYAMEDPGLEQDAQGRYIISSIDDWNYLAGLVEAGQTAQGKPFYNQSYIMTENIGSALCPVTTMMGCQTGDKNTRKRFTGTFDGGGHTLYVSLVSDTADSPRANSKFNPNYVAPFAYVSRTTIQNLTVEGSITCTGQFGGGIIGSSGNGAADGACTLTNCHVNATLISNYTLKGTAYANFGGLMGIAEGAAAITDCSFKGCMVVNAGKDYQYSGGFIGLNKGNSTVSNSLFFPSKIVGDAAAFANSKLFTNDNASGKLTVTNSYYVVAFGVDMQKAQRVFPDGQPGYVSSSTPFTGPDGEVYRYFADYADVNLTAHAAQLNGQQLYFTTFYHPLLSFTLQDGAMALIMDESHSLYVLGDGELVPQDCAVIIMSHSADVCLAHTEETMDTVEGNVLKGNAKEVDTPSDTFVLGCKDNGSLGFLSYTGETLPANKAFLQIVFK